MKIVTLFLLFLLLSNFASNYINLLLNRGEQIRLLKELLRKDLVELTGIIRVQYELYEETQGSTSRALVIENITESAALKHTGMNSLTVGLRPDGSLLFQSSQSSVRFRDADALNTLNERLQGGAVDGRIDFTFDDLSYFGIYRYDTQWDAYIIRAEEYTEFYAESTRNFITVMGFVILVTIVSVIVGIILVRHVLRFVPKLTQAIMNMQKEQSLERIDMHHAPNDEITYLGMAFNSLADTIDNLLTIFRKFVTRNVAQKAYQERNIRLEGVTKNLTILFTDIRRFTHITEMLGNDIIKLLNIHYERAIQYIHDAHGDIGSIIGDALLAMFGNIDSDTNKSVQAIAAGYKILSATAELRTEMHQRKEEIIAQRGTLTMDEQEVYKAVLLEVGVGIDGGEVFYGNIGSSLRMVNTVIGDNVNSASRLEGLTRIYNAPIICSEFVRREAIESSDIYHFMELDQVQVKGKNIHSKIYWPILKTLIDDGMQNEIELFARALERYYSGGWEQANADFRQCMLPVSFLFAQRTASLTPPKHWQGIWEMSEK